MWWITGPIFTINRGVPFFNALVKVNP